MILAARAPRRPNVIAGEVSCRSMANALSPTMTVRDFESGYWYRDQLKNFAERIGIPAAKQLRKDELEKAIVAFLRTGSAALPTNRSLRKTGIKDVERGLNLKLRIEHYTSNRETSSTSARTMRPGSRREASVTERAGDTGGAGAGRPRVRLSVPLAGRVSRPSSPGREASRPSSCASPGLGAPSP